MGQELILGGMSDVVPERLCEELVRGGQVLLAVPQEHARPALECRPGRLGDKGGLAYAGLTRDEQHLALVAPGDALGGIQQRLQLGFPSDHADRRPHNEATRKRDGGTGVGPAEGLPEHLDRLDGVGQSFQDESSDRAAFVTAAPTGHSPHHVGRQNLPALAGGTESSRLDDRVAEVVAVLSTDFASAQPDPKAHRVLPATVVPFDALLHDHPARQGGRGRGEHHHEPITQILHLGATCFGDRLAQDREMISANLVGRFGRQALRQLRRAHHVGEQDRHVLGRQDRILPTGKANRVVERQIVPLRRPGTSTFGVAASSPTTPLGRSPTISRIAEDF